MTLGENIADNNGIKLAYNAMIKEKQKIAQKKINQDLINYGFSHEQIYYIQYAQSWCSKETIQYQNYLLNNDVHSPHKFRVLGVLKNDINFSKAFNCKENDVYYYKNYCTIW
jgi:predicted metalloendopeptidase